VTIVQNAGKYIEIVHVYANLYTYIFPVAALGRTWLDNMVQNAMTRKQNNNGTRRNTYILKLQSK